MNTLLPFRYRRLFKAQRGAHGEGSDRAGRSGRDLTIGVPPGTIVLDEATGDRIADLVAAGEQVVVARGGRGGRGGFGGGRGGAPVLQPGQYTVRLTVDGKTYAQPAVIKPDPRGLPANASAAAGGN